MSQMLVLSDKDFEASIMKMLQKSIINSLETKKLETLSQDTKVIKKNKMEIIELRNTIIKIKKKNLIG